SQLQDRAGAQPLSQGSDCHVGRRQLRPGAEGGLRRVGRVVAPAFLDKIVQRSEAAARVAALPQPVVFTNGVFDVLHRGHVTYLAQARALGASLVVALNTDASVRRLGKGEDRPINVLEDRAAVIAALQSVSLVTWFDADTPLDLIILTRPDVLAKG